MNENARLETIRSIHELCAKSRHLRRRGQFDDAKTEMLSALKLFHSTSGLDQVNLATILDELANVCFCRQEYAEAEKNYRGAIAVLEETLDREHACLAPLLDHLARLLIVQCKFEEAELVCTRSLTIKKASILVQNSDTLESMRMTAIVELCLGNFDSAEILLKKGLEILEASTIGPFEEFLRLMARVHEGKGDKPEAERCYRRAIEVFKCRRGDQSGRAQCEMDFARLLDELGRHGEARLARRMALVAEESAWKLDDLPESPDYQPLSYPVSIFH